MPSIAMGSLLKLTGELKEFSAASKRVRRARGENDEFSRKLADAGEQSGDVGMQIFDRAELPPRQRKTALAESNMGDVGSD